MNALKVNTKRIFSNLSCAISLLAAMLAKYQIYLYEYCRKGKLLVIGFTLIYAIGFLTLAWYLEEDVTEKKRDMLGKSDKR